MSTIRRRRRGDEGASESPATQASNKGGVTPAFSNLGDASPPTSPKNIRRGGVPDPSATPATQVALPIVVPDDNFSLTGNTHNNNGGNTHNNRSRVDETEVKVTPKYLMKLFIIIPLIFLASTIALMVMLGFEVSTYIETVEESDTVRFLAKLSEVSTSLALEHYTHPHSYDAATKASVLAALEGVREHAKSVDGGTASLEGIFTVANDADTHYVTEVIAAITVAFGPLLQHSTPTPKLLTYFQLALAWTYVVKQHDAVGTLQETLHTSWTSKTAAHMMGSLKSLSTMHDHVLVDFLPTEFVPTSNQDDIADLITVFEGRLNINYLLPNRSFTAAMETKKVLDATSELLLKQRGLIEDESREGDQQSVLVELSLAIFALLVGFIVSLVLIRDQHLFLGRRVVLQQDFRLLAKGIVTVNPRTLNTMTSMCQRLGVMSRTVPRSQAPNQAELHLQCAVVPLQKLRPFMPSYAFEDGAQETELMVGNNDEVYLSESVPRLNLNQTLKRSLSTCLVFVDLSILNFIKPQRAALKIQAQKAASAQEGGGQAPVSHDDVLSARTGLVQTIFKNLLMGTQNDGMTATHNTALPPGLGQAFSTASADTHPEGAAAVGGSTLSSEQDDNDAVFGPECFSDIFIIAQKVASHFQGAVLQTSPKGILLGFQRAHVLGHHDRKGSCKPAHADHPLGEGGPTSTPTQSPAERALSLGTAATDTDGSDPEDDDEDEAENLAVHTAIGIQELIRTQISPNLLAPISIVSGTAVEGLLSTHMSKFYSVIGPLVSELGHLQRLGAKHDTAITVDSRTSAVIGNREFLTRPVDFILDANYRTDAASATGGGGTGGGAAATTTTTTTGATEVGGSTTGAHIRDPSSEKEKVGVDATQQQQQAAAAAAVSTTGPTITVLPEDATTIVYQVVLERPNFDVDDREAVLAMQAELENQMQQWDSAFQVYMTARRHPNLDNLEEAYKALDSYRQLNLSVGDGVAVHPPPGGSPSGSIQMSPSGGPDTSGAAGAQDNVVFMQDRPFDVAFEWTVRQLNILGVTMAEGD